MSSYNESIPQPKWIPYDQRDTAWWIWNELYQCSIPYIQMLTMEELQEFGMPTSGDAAYDYSTANELRQVMIPISEMVKYYHRGAQVYVTNPADTKRIYDRISDHLIAWKQKLTKSLNMRNAPLEDLKLMDQFANAVYEHAKFQFTDDTIASILTNRVDNRQLELVKLTAMLDGGVAAMKQEEQSLEERYPARESMSEFFQPYRNTKPLTRKSNTPSKGLNGDSGASISRPSVSDFIGGAPVYK